MAPRHRVADGEIARALLAWYRKAHRDLPWRRTSDPYRVWISEIMLQQTRAQTVIPYYERFLNRFPCLDDLACAHEDEVLALWSGLGYYSRARNLLRAAREVHAEGVFPSRFEDLRALPGVGEYTAAAIASIAFGLPHVVLDGNVIRVVARVRNDASEAGSSRTRERFREIAQGWLDRRNPGDFNQSLMELGATVCVRGTPLCGGCPIRRECAAFCAGTTASLPVKIRKAEAVSIRESLLLISAGGRVLLLRGHPSAKRMAGFLGLPTAGDLPDIEKGKCIGSFRHTITCHHYAISVYAAADGRHSAGELERRGEFGWFALEQLPEIPLCTTARKALQLAGLVGEPSRPG